MYLKKLLTIIKEDRVAFTMGMCIIALAVMGTSVRHVSSSMFGLLFILSLSALLSWPKIFSSLTKTEKLFVFAFILYFISGLLAYYNVDDVDKYIKLLERYLRFLMVIPVFFLIIKKRKSLINYLYIGAGISGPFVFFVALNHYSSFPGVPAKGYYHHIIFGQLAMINAGIMISYLITNKLSRTMQFLILISILCGLVAVVLSQARGVWLVFPVYLLIAGVYLFNSGRLRLQTVSVLLVVSFLLVVFTPAGDLIQQRTKSASSEISAFYEDGKYISSVGTRLAMWEIAIDVWKRHLVVGTGPGDFDNEVMVLQNNGEYVGMDVHNSVHNIYIQALVGSGVVGFLALIFVLIMPLAIVFNKNNCEESAKLTGLIIILSFAVFGVSESWVLRLSIISIFLIYTIVVISHMHISGRYSKY
ncbi:hypothetical protein MNBD_GAMMA06-1433 [hydrothermal vent metagenome]|uniref:O-antigen ligase-related domain-containing protein n=1 Tax=hydrothermal vent metagenome TaxID=652676 RepID=A0A3B0XAL3_9ZZZZ